MKVVCLEPFEALAGSDGGRRARTLAPDGHRNSNDTSSGSCGNTSSHSCFKSRLLLLLFLLSSALSSSELLVMVPRSSVSIETSLLSSLLLIIPLDPLEVELMDLVLDLLDGAQVGEEVVDRGVLVAKQ